LAAICRDHAQPFNEVATLNSNKDPHQTEVIIVIESPLVRFDVQDTLRDLGIVYVRGVSTPRQALAALGKERCDVVILGLETISLDCQRLFDALELFDIPVVNVASGMSLEDTLPRRARMESLQVPVSSMSLEAALERALRSGFKQPGAS
jgi:DNA-binding NtrC family response regulator